MRLRFGFRLPFPLGNAFIFVKWVDLVRGKELLSAVAEVKGLATLMGFGSVADRIVCEES